MIRSPRSIFVYVILFVTRAIIFRDNYECIKREKIALKREEKEKTIANVFFKDLVVLQIHINRVFAFFFGNLFY